jgi:nicotinate-nucleotide adenylyltransferase
MRLGLFGGSFDPVHAGHVRPIQEARERLGLDRVIYLPTAQPPHKPGQQFAPAHARFSMVELALLDEPDLQVSALELTPGRTSYTIDTLEHFHAEHPEAELYLLLGGDSFVTLESWKRWRDIVALARLVVLVRPRWEIERTRRQLSDQLARLAADDRVHFLSNPAVEVSSTRLRELIRAGEPVPAEDMSPRVLKYVRKYSLYR